MATTRTTLAVRVPRRIGVLLAVFAALFAVFLMTAPPASAAVGDEDDPYRISGNVQLDGEPLEACTSPSTDPAASRRSRPTRTASGASAFRRRTTTTSITLDEQTLPEGIAVVDPEDDTPNVKEAEVGNGGRVTVNFFIGEGTRNVTSFFDQLIQRIVNGLSFGLMLALAAVGLTLVYGTTGISNFAHAEMVTFGPVVAAALVGAGTVALPLWIGLPIAVILSALLGLLLDVIIWRPLRRKRVGVVQLMIVSIGLSLMLRYIYQFFIGGGTSQLPYSSTEKLPLFGVVKMSVVDMASFAICIVVIVGLRPLADLLAHRQGDTCHLGQLLAGRGIRYRRRCGGAGRLDHRRHARGPRRHPVRVLPPGPQVGHGSAGAAAHVRGRDPGWSRHRVRRAGRIAHRRACSSRSRRSGSRPTSSTPARWSCSSSSCCSARRASSAAAKE